MALRDSSLENLPDKRRMRLEKTLFQENAASGLLVVGRLVFDGEWRIGRRRVVYDRRILFYWQLHSLRLLISRGLRLPQLLLQLSQPLQRILREDALVVGVR